MSFRSSHPSSEGTAPTPTKKCSFSMLHKLMTGFSGCADGNEALCPICSRAVQKEDKIVCGGATFHVCCFVCGGTDKKGCKRLLSKTEFRTFKLNPYCPACYVEFHIADEEGKDKEKELEDEKLKKQLQEIEKIILIAREEGEDEDFGVPPYMPPAVPAPSFLSAASQPSFFTSGNPSLMPQSKPIFALPSQITVGVTKGHTGNSSLNKVSPTSANSVAPSPETPPKWYSLLRRNERDKHSTPKKLILPDEIEVDPMTKKERVI